MSNGSGEGCIQPTDNFPVVFITGLSGSGKSTALSVYEDMGFLTVDGLPATLIPQLVTEVLQHENRQMYHGLAVGLDLRQAREDSALTRILQELRKKSISPRILFFEAKADVLLKRYATTRRPHPLEKEGIGLEEALQEERTRMRHLRKMADLVLDTSSHSVHDLRRTLQAKWKDIDPAKKGLRVHIISFGFKHGTPSDADMLFDLRFLPNPFFVPELKPLSGLDASVSDFVLKAEPGQTFFSHLCNLLQFVLKESDVEGRFRTTIGIGCTGGRHRSVATAEALAKLFREENYPVTLEHRHIQLG